MLPLVAVMVLHRGHKGRPILATELLRGQDLRQETLACLGDTQEVLHHPDPHLMATEVPSNPLSKTLEEEEEALLEPVTLTAHLKQLLLEIKIHMDLLRLLPSVEIKILMDHLKPHLLAIRTRMVLLRLHQLDLLTLTPQVATLALRQEGPHQALISGLRRSFT